ncbi:MAG: ADP-dependent NAD(P)H-hydrate dehydratase / NAD(P)H-hydrate epimerase [Actinomycetota bacterium]|nr:ADP-dependent NAD(P)H-hydrate dehydratase / NAD(P)H-hydrate epimerase [Actinomycetota bacterium]
MSAADRRTIAAGTPVEVLMERAGRAVAWQVRRVTGGAYGRHVVVVCGKGNNGGDGLVAARTLAHWGMRSHVFELEPGVDRARFERALATADVAVDAMYGTGFRGTLEGDAAWIAERLRAWGRPTVAVDIPSGVDGLRGITFGPVVDATVTVTFAARKPGLVFEPGRAHAGEVVVADIGIDLGDAADVVVSLGLVEPSDVRGWLPQRAPDAHKWQSGVMVVGGSGGMMGAPMFVSHAAMRAGAGIVWCAVPGEDTARAASGSEVITRALPATPGGALARDAAETVLADVGRFRAIAVGPGLGSEPTVGYVVRALVAEARIPMVLDADGLNALHGDLTPLSSRQTRGAPIVLTPHAGEYERLMGAPVGDDRITAARALADRSGAVVLLKGPGTVIAAPRHASGPGRVALNPTGGAALATAGSGDVLTGIIAAFLARGMEAFAAAAAGAWVHGRIADEFTATTGPGLVASDLITHLPRTLAGLTTGDDDR